MPIPSTAENSSSVERRAIWWDCKVFQKNPHSNSSSGSRGMYALGSRYIVPFMRYSSRGHARITPKIPARNRYALCGKQSMAQIARMLKEVMPMEKGLYVR